MPRTAGAGYYLLMFVDRLIDLIERTVNFTFSKRAIRRISLVIRLAFIFAFTFVIFRLAPTMADELTPTPDTEIVATSTPTPEPEPSESAPTPPEPMPTSSTTPVPVPTEEPIAPVPSASPTPSASTTPPPPTALVNQNMQLRVPTSLLVDPRARSASLSELYVAGPQNLLVCIAGGSAISDVYLKNFVDSDFGGKTLVAGDRTSNVRVTGSVDQVLTLLNSAQGVRVSSLFGTMLSQSISFRFVATSVPTLDPALCAKAWPTNTRTLTFRKLGLQIEMKKGDIILKR
jgi:hypothetical protein